MTGVATDPGMIALVFFMMTASFIAVFFTLWVLVAGIVFLRHGRSAGARSAARRTGCCSFVCAPKLRELQVALVADAAGWAAAMAWAVSAAFDARYGHLHLTALIAVSVFKVIYNAAVLCLLLAMGSRSGGGGGGGGGGTAGAVVAPIVALQPGEQEELRAVLVPPGFPPGTTFQVLAPNGQHVEVQVPLDAVAGTAIRVRMPPAASQQQQQQQQQQQPGSGGRVRGRPHALVYCASWALATVCLAAATHGNMLAWGTATLLVAACTWHSHKIQWQRQQQQTQQTQQTQQAQQTQQQAQQVQQQAQQQAQQQGGDSIAAVNPTMATAVEVPTAITVIVA